jgi:hypothetical protein
MASTRRATKVLADPRLLLFSDTGIKALKILGIAEEQIAKQDLVIFLYAVGLVGLPCMAVSHVSGSIPLGDIQSSTDPVILGRLHAESN